MKSLRTLFALLLFAGLSSFSTCHAQEVEQHLAAGEFGAAMQIAQNIPVGQRDPVLAQIASAQTSTGESTAAGGTDNLAPGPVANVAAAAPSRATSGSTPRSAAPSLVTSA